MNKIILCMLLIVPGATAIAAAPNAQLIYELLANSGAYESGFSDWKTVEVKKLNCQQNGSLTFSCAATDSVENPFFIAQATKLVETIALTAPNFMDPTASPRQFVESISCNHVKISGSNFDCTIKTSSSHSF